MLGLALWGVLASGSGVAIAGDESTPEDAAPTETSSAAAPATEAEAPKAAWEKKGMGWAALPAVNYDSDTGFGMGVIGSLYWYDTQTQPYKTKLSFLVYFTTKGVQTHRLEIDTLDLGDLPLRLSARVELDHSRTANYCGQGPDVPCDPAVAEEEADTLGLTGADREEFLKRYYQYRYVSPNGFLKARWKLRDLPHRVELFGSWRGRWVQPGTLSLVENYEGSLYDQTFPDGDKGFFSVVEAGVMADNRDNEPAPNKGYWVETSLRTAGPWTGSSWTLGGFNTTLRGYYPLWGPDRLVLAGRAVFDGMFGDAPVLEMGTPGGFQPYSWWGGQRGGRGIRLSRYLGDGVLALQPELRWKFAKFRVADVPIALTLLAYSDLAWIAEELGDPFGGPFVGEGGGLRVGLGDNFIVRVDVAVSALEDYSPQIYIDLDHLF